MKRSWKSRIKAWGLDLVRLAILVAFISIVKDGMWLFGVPSAGDVSKVTVSCPSVTDGVRAYTDPETIDLAVELTGFLKYSLLETPKGDRDGAVEITYTLRSGETVTVAADETTVWWKGRARAVRDPGAFVYLVRVDFFGEDSD